jgi:hypothetical protein
LRRSSSLVSSSTAQASGKKKVNCQDDLPRFSYPVKGSASELVEADDATFNAFASKVRSDLDRIFREYEISDKATLRSLLNADIYLDGLAGDYQAAVENIDKLRAQEEKPSAKLFSGVIAQALMQAAIDTKSASSPVFEESVRK